MSDDEIVKEFLIESHENLDRLDQDLIVLEKDPGNRDTLASIFRTIHTIKGTSGFLAFNQLEALTHAGENLLAKLRDGLLALTPEITTALLAMLDAVRQMLASIEATGAEGERNNQELIETLARLEMEGKETELDKTIIEAIKDPLTHLVRNAVDHGIEAPEARRAAGKDPEGRLYLRAFHEGGQVNIEITDDGAGLDYEKIRNKAVQKGLITGDQAARMTEREIANLIFMPGLSTAAKVTNVSGRGVGMDVVKTNIEKIGGTVDVQSKAGQGSTIRMKIPLTLAIIPALIVTTSGDRYAIPQVSLLELVRLEGEQVRNGIELVNGAPVYRLRGRLLPLVYLSRELVTGTGLQTPPSSNEAGTDEEMQSVNIVVLRADDRRFGLVVDEINDTEEIVVKPLSKQLKSINTYAGATIMGDGKVALILDVLGLAQRANVVGEVRDRTVTEKEGKQQLDAANGSRCNAVLLFQYGESERMAIDLALVARLEEFPSDAVEIAADQKVVQYRGQIMPLIRVSEMLESRHRKAVENAPQSLQVVVYAEKGRSVGLVVDRILDIVEESFVMQRQTGRTGVMGSAVIQKRVTDILDVPGLIAVADHGQLLAGMQG